MPYVCVPDTTDFSLQDVYDSVSSHAPTVQDDLIDCFDKAVSSYFDSTYSGSKNSLYNFRNYCPYTLLDCAVDIKTINATTTTGANLSYPDNIVSGETLFIVVAVNQACTVYTPSGFTYISSTSNGTDSYSTYIFYRIATGSESGTVYVNSDKTTGSSWEHLLGAAIWRLPDASIYRSTNTPDVFSNTSSESGTDTISYMMGVRAWVQFSRPALTGATQTFGGDYTNSGGPVFGNLIRIDVACTSSGTRDYTYSSTSAITFVVSHLVQFD